MTRSLQGRGGFNPPIVTSNDGIVTKELSSKSSPNKVKISEEKQLVLEIVNTATQAGARLLLAKLRKRFGS